MTTTQASEGRLFHYRDKRIFKQIHFRFKEAVAKWRKRRLPLREAV
ncbi:hypothetical protein [Numidum massiliense]|nr:hypothetical protein [Numidum massiliense]